MKNNLPQLGASTWQVALGASQELTQQSPLRLKEKRFGIRVPLGLSAGDPAWWENPRLVLGQLMTPAAPIRLRCPSAGGQGCSCPVGRAPLLPGAVHPVVPWGQIQSGRLAQRTREGKRKAFWLVSA